jgi:hypothetical protein
MTHDTVIKHRFDWAAGEHGWYVECFDCDWVSDLQRTPQLAEEREAEHLRAHLDDADDAIEDVTP